MPIYKMNGKKEGKQKYRVRINFIDNMSNPKQIDRVAYGLEEAKMLEMNLSQNLKEEAVDKATTLQMLYDEYVEVMKHEIRESSLKTSSQILQKYVLPPLGSVKLNKLTLPVLQKWKLLISNMELSIVTKQKIYSYFRAILNYAVKMEYVTMNPIVKIGNFKDSGESEKKKIDYYTADEFKKFISSARGYAMEAERNGNVYEWNFYVFFAIAFYTGLRKGEIHGLCWGDIDGEFLSVRRSVNQKLLGDDRETAPKNRTSIRIIQMPKPLIDILEKHKQRCLLIPGFENQYKICGGIRPLRDTTIQLRNKLYSDAAGVKVIRIHDFRHSHASLLANAGVNIQEISRRLGHAKVEITWNVYSHLYPREEERAIEVLNQI